MPINRETVEPEGRGLPTRLDVLREEAIRDRAERQPVLGRVLLGERVTAARHGADVGLGELAGLVERQRAHAPESLPAHPAADRPGTPG